MTLNPSVTLTTANPLPFLTQTPALRFGVPMAQPAPHVRLIRLDEINEEGHQAYRQALANVYQPTVYHADEARFAGYVRADGRVGTRNYIGVISSVNCSATVCKQIAATFDAGRLRDYPNVDGVVAITHGSGCGMGAKGEGIEILQRTLRGYADHVKFAGVLVIGLG